MNIDKGKPSWAIIIKKHENKTSFTFRDKEAKHCPLHHNSQVNTYLVKPGWLSVKLGSQLMYKTQCQIKY